jgi:hypothetical protein
MTGGGISTGVSVIPIALKSAIYLISWCSAIQKLVVAQPVMQAECLLPFSQKSAIGSYHGPVQPSQPVSVNSIFMLCFHRF